MSSILDALKKLEQTSPRPRGIGGRRGSPYLTAGSMGHADSIRGKKWLLLGAISILLVSTAGGVWYFFANKDQTVQPVSPNPKPSPKQQKTVSAPLPPARTSQSSKSVKPSPDTRSTQPAATKSRAVQKAAVTAPPPQKSVKTPSTKTVPAVPAKTVSPRPTPPVGAKSVDSLPKLEDADVKLQAISWAEIPENRMAVINSKILREGESVDGYVVDRIGEDGVVLMKGGASWKLPIRLK